MAGRSMTTHWQWFDAFAQRYPSVSLERRLLITQSDSVFCVSSVNSVADLMVYLCGNLLPSCRKAHRESVLSRDPPAFSPSPLGAPRDRHHDELVADVQIELLRDLREPVRVAALAASSGVSARTLTRRFKSATGVSISEYLQRRRLDEAQALLRRTNLSVTEVASSVGLSDPSHFTRTFRQHTGLTPTAFRTAVRQKGFGVSLFPAELAGLIQFGLNARPFM